MNVEETLQERGAIYGDYYKGVEARAKIMKILWDMHEDEVGDEMSDEAYGMIFDIVNKLIRIGVSPDHIDSWHDIAGYSTLTEAHLNANK